MHSCPVVVVVMTASALPMSVVVFVDFVMTPPSTHWWGTTL